MGTEQTKQPHHDFGQPKVAELNLAELQLVQSNPLCVNLVHQRIDEQLEVNLFVYEWLHVLRHSNFIDEFLVV